jgi:hypothetical protein
MIFGPYGWISERFDNSHIGGTGSMLAPRLAFDNGEASGAHLAKF